jgi:hypothetical protein
MQSLQIASSEHEEQLCSLAQLSHWISCYKIWNQFQIQSLQSASSEHEEQHCSLAQLSHGMC